MPTLGEGGWVTHILGLVLGRVIYHFLATDALKVHFVFFMAEACSSSQRTVRCISAVQEPKLPLLSQQMAGNPDQQEDNVDEQYQEEGEEEVGRWDDAGDWPNRLVPHTHLRGSVGSDAPS